MKKQLFYFLFYSVILLSYGQDTLIYKGFVTVSSSGTMYPYELQFSQNEKDLEGISITNKGLKDETKNRIKGLFYGKGNALTFQEMSIIETRSEEELGTFCYLQLELIKNKKQLTGKFIGYFNDSVICAQGEVFLMEDKILKKKLKKLNKKLSKIDTLELKKIISNPDTLNKKINTNIINPLKMKNKDTYFISVSGPFFFSIWDNKKEDGDIVKIIANNEVVLDNFMLKNKKHTIEFDYDNHGTSIKIIAKNIGDKPPNSVTIEITSGNKKFPLQAKLNKDEYIQIKVN